MNTCIVETPLRIGLEIRANDGLIVAADFVARKPATARITDPVLREAALQVRAYFNRKLQVFDLPLHFEGTALQVETWRAVSTLAFGHFVSYAEVAHAIGHPRSHRGVAAAMGKTKIDLFVPAHRVVGADGRLRGCTPRSIRARLAVFEGKTLAGLTVRGSGATRP